MYRAASQVPLDAGQNIANGADAVRCVRDVELDAVTVT
jgi:hypothetical protein